MSVIVPVILCGGGGSRLWPLSRKSLPKQFLPLVGSQTMLQETLQRVAPSAGFAAPVLVCNEEHRFLVAEQTRATGIQPAAILLEPVGRNTAPAIAVAARAVQDIDPHALMLVLPSDHVIGKADEFRAAVARAAAPAADGAFVMFGIQPTGPHTGYGYIETGDVAGDGLFAIRRFHEKPSLQTATEYLEAGGFYWNSGMFMFPVAGILQELDALAPDVSRAALQAYGARSADLDFVRLSRAEFEEAPDVSVDVAVMEQTRCGVVMPVDIGWSDVGTWDALWEISPQDETRSVVVGDVITNGVTGSYLRSEGPMVAAVGVEDLIVVATRDAVLVSSLSHAQDVKKVVESLILEHRSEAETSDTVYRPWGNYTGIDLGERFQVKRIVVDPGKKLSLQMHHHRAEHWIVVSGTAEVTCDDRTFLLNENQSTFIPQGAVHRLANPGRIPLHLIEVQSGSYLGEDDIVRIADEFGRVAG